MLAPAQAADEMGRLGPYRVLKLLGQGGMGMVFLAEDPRLHRKVALKAMLPSIASIANARERFLREARAAAAVEHDHIIAIFQVEEDRGIPYIAMPLLRGESFETRLKRQGKLPLAEVVRIGRETAEGLEAAHAAGLIHRDIKPANLWLEGEQGRVKILDFGLARSGHDEGLTQQGAILGTPAYMAPEQARGDTVDGRADLFSLGCMLYRACTGRTPFHGTDILSVLRAIATETPPAPQALDPAIPKALSDLIMRLLAKDPAERPQSAAEAIKALRALEHMLAAAASPALSSLDRSHQADSADTIPLPQRSGWRHSARWLVPIAVIALALGLLFAFRPRSSQPPPPSGTLAQSDQPQPAPPEVIPPEPGQGSGVGTAQSLRPMSDLALVTRPALLPGVHSWTLETRSPRGGGSFRMGGGSSVSPDGRRFAVVSTDGAIRIRSTRDGQVEQVLEAEGAVEHLAWSPRGTLLAGIVRSPTPRLALWELPSGQRLDDRSLPFPRAANQEHFNVCPCLAWDATGKRLATASDRLRVWEAARPPRLLASLETETDPKNRLSTPPFVGLAWSPTTLDEVVTLNRDGKLQRWDLTAKRAVLDWKADVPIHGMVDLAYSPDGKLLACTRGRIRTWDPRTGKLAATLQDPGPMQGTAVWSPDSRQLAFHSGGYPSAVVLYDAATGKRARTLAVWSDDEPRLRGWLSDGSGIAYDFGGGGAAVLDVATGKPLWLTEVNRREDGLAWAPDGRGLATFETDLAVRSWDLAASRQRAVRTLGPAGVVSSSLPPLFVWPSGGQLLLLARPGSAEAELLDSLTLKRDRTVPFPGGRGASQLFCSPDGRHLALTANSKLTVCDLPEGKNDQELTDRLAGRIEAAWSPDGKALVVAEAAFWRLSLWENRQGKWGFVKSLRGPYGVNQLIWRPDGKQLATTGPSDLSFGLLDLPALKLLPVVAQDPAGGPIQAATLRWLPERQGFLGVFGWWSILHFDRAAQGIMRFPEGQPGPTLIGPLPLHAFVRLAPDGRMAATIPGVHPGSNIPQTTGVWLWHVESGRPTGVMVPLSRERWLTISPEGHYHGSPGIEDELVYVVRTDRGEETLTPEAFAQRFGWKNDPARVRLLGPPEDGLRDADSFPPPPGARILFDGKGLEAWQPATARVVDRTSLIIGNRDLVSKEKRAGRFRFHLEYRLPPRAKPDAPGAAHSGLLVQGRYLVPIRDSFGLALDAESTAAIYRQYPPRVRADRPAGAWNSLEVEFEAPGEVPGPPEDCAWISVWHNGFPVVAHIPLRVPTEQAYDRRMNGPGPMVLQAGSGDVQFRNIWLLPLPSLDLIGK